MVYIRSLRNCSLEGPAPDVSGIPQLGYLYVELWIAYYLTRNNMWPICLGKKSCTWCLEEFGCYHLLLSLFCWCFRDISWNQLTGPIPFGQLASNLTTMYKKRPLTTTHVILFLKYHLLIFFSQREFLFSHSLLQVVQRSFPQSS